MIANLLRRWRKSFQRAHIASLEEEIAEMDAELQGYKDAGYINAYVMGKRARFAHRLDRLKKELQS